MSGLMLNKEATKEQLEFGKKYIDIIIDTVKQFESMEDTNVIKNAILPKLDADMELNVFSWGDINILFNEKTHPVTAVSVRVNKKDLQEVVSAVIELSYEYVTDDYMPYDTISYNHRII